MRKPRIGHIEFLNCFPLHYALVKNNILCDIELVKENPARLNAMLFAGGRERLDVSAVSSIAYARNWQKLVLMPEISISSEHEVMSVCLVSKKKIDALDGAAIALTNTSATSQILLKIILADKYGVYPRFIECAPDLPEMLQQADAALLIGDPALFVHHQKPAGLYIYDLGTEWKGLTGYNMVYGLWVINRDFAASQREVARKISRDFAAAMGDALSDIDAVSRQAAQWGEYPPEFLKKYFLTLKYSFDEPYQRGLVEYYRRAKAHDFIAESPALEFFEG